MRKRIISFAVTISMLASFFVIPNFAYAETFDYGTSLLDNVTLAQKSGYTYTYTVTYDMTGTAEPQFVLISKTFLDDNETNIDDTLEVGKDTIADYTDSDQITTSALIKPGQQTEGTSYTVDLELKGTSYEDGTTFYLIFSGNGSSLYCKTYTMDSSGNLTLAGSDSGDDTEITYTVEYKSATDESATYSSTAPTNADTYNVKVTLTGDSATNYSFADGADSVEFTGEDAFVISPAELTVSYTGDTPSVNVGATDLTVTLSASDFSIQSGLIDPDTATLAGDSVTGTFDSAASATDSATVTVSGLTVSNSNYTLPNPLTITGTVKAAQTQTYLKVEPKTGVKFKNAAFTESELVTVGLYSDEACTSALDASAYTTTVKFSQDGAEVTSVKNAGTYNISVSATVNDANSYLAPTAVEDKTVEIAQATLTGLTITTDPTTMSYTAGDTFAKTGVTATAIYNGDTEDYKIEITVNADAPNLYNALTVESPSGATDGNTLTTSDNGQQVAFKYVSNVTTIVNAFCDDPTDSEQQTAAKANVEENTDGVTASTTLTLTVTENTNVALTLNAGGGTLKDGSDNDATVSVTVDRAKTDYTQDDIKALANNAISAANATLTAPANYKLYGWSTSGSNSNLYETETTAESNTELNFSGTTNTLYAIWVKKTAATTSELSYTTPSTETYNGQNKIADDAVSFATGVTALNSDESIVIKYAANSGTADNAKELSEFTGGKLTADTYNVYAEIPETADYASGTVSLGSWTINKASIDVQLAENVTVEKPYDGGTDVKVKGSDGTTYANLAVSDLALDTDDIISISGTSDKVSLDSTATISSASYSDANVAYTDNTKTTVTTKSFTVMGLSLTGDDQDNYEIAATVSLTGKITPAETTATLQSGTTKSKVYGSSTNISLSTSDFDFSPAIVENYSTITFSTVANDANKDVGDYAITAADSAGNYTVTVDSNSKASVTACPTVVTVTPKTNVAYTGSELGASALVESANVYRDENNDGTADDSTSLGTVPTGNITFLSTTAAANATATSTVTDAGIYYILVAATTLENNSNYAAASAITSTDKKTVTVGKADYKAENITGQIKTGTALNGYTFNGTVKDLSNADVSGSFTVTSATETTAGESNATSHSVTCSFKATNEDNNYNQTLTGISATLTVTDKTPVTVTLEKSEVSYNGSAQQPSITGLDGLTNTNDYTITYKKNGAETTDFTNAGKVTITVTLVNTTDYSLTDATDNAVTLTYTIKPVTLGLSYSDASITKTYNGNSTATIDTSKLSVTGAVTDNSVALDTSGNIAAKFTDANGEVSDAGSNYNVTITGLSLTNNDDGNYALPSPAVLSGIGSITASATTISGVTAATDATYTGSSLADSLIDKSKITVTDAGNNTVTTSVPVTVTFYSDEARMTEVAAPTTPGTYYYSVTGKSGSNNYSDPTAVTGSVAIGNATYTTSGAFTGTVIPNTTLAGYTFTPSAGTVSGVITGQPADGWTLKVTAVTASSATGETNPTVAGTLGTQYTVTCTFVPANDDSSKNYYNELNNITATLTVANTAHDVTISVSNDLTYGGGTYTPTVTITNADDALTDAMYDIVYYSATKDEETGAYTKGGKLTAQPTDAGTYFAAVELKSEYANSDRLTGTTEVQYTIKRATLTATLTDNAENTLTMNYGQTAPTVNTNMFTYADFVNNETATTADLTNISVAVSDAYAEAEGAVGEYAIVFSASAGNYDVTTEATLKVSACPTVAVVTANSGLKYKGSDFTDSEVIKSYVIYKNPDGKQVTELTDNDAVAEGNISEITYTYKLNNETATVKNAGTYSVSAAGKHSLGTNYAQPEAAETTLAIDKASLSALAVTTEPAASELKYTEGDALNVTTAVVTAYYNGTLPTSENPQTEVIALDKLTITAPANYASLTTSDNGSIIAFKYTVSADDTNVNEGNATAQTTSTITVNEKTYTINCDYEVTDENGNKVTEAKAGETVYVNPTPTTGYNTTVTYGPEGETPTEATETDKGFAIVVPAADFTVNVNTTASKIDYTVTNSSAEGVDAKGYITAQEKANYQDEVTVTVYPADGYEIDKVNAAPTKIGSETLVPVTKNSDGTYKFTMPAENVTISATFKEEDKYAITVDVTGGKIATNAADNEANEGDTVTLTPTADSGYEYEKDSLKVVNDATGEEIALDENNAFTMPASSVTVTATFNKLYAITKADTEHGSFEVAAQAKAGDTVAVTTDADSGYIVNTVSCAETASGTAVTVKNKKFTMPAADVTVTVTFKKSGGGSSGGSSTYTVKYSAGAHGTIDEGGVTSETVTSGAYPKSTPTVTAEEGYTFIGWSTDGETVVDPATVAIKKATTFTALYEENEPQTTPEPTEAPDRDYHAKYISGYEEDGSFRPENPITRAEAATIFSYALAEYDGQTYDNAYADLDLNNWYAPYILYMSELGIMTGYEDGTVRADNYITRQEFSTMIALLAGAQTAQDMPFEDITGDEWGIDYIYTVYANGYVTGYEDNTFRPYNNITRAEAVRIVNGYLQRSVDEAGLENVDYNVFYDVPESHWAYYDVIEAANDHYFEKDTSPESWID